MVLPVLQCMSLRKHRRGHQQRACYRDVAALRAATSLAGLAGTRGSRNAINE
jgi:hypothetical protein